MKTVIRIEKVYFKCSTWNKGSKGFILKPHSNGLAVNKAKGELYFMTFGEAIEYLKKKHKVARAGWNGKNMFLFLADGSDLNKFLYGETFKGYEAERVNCLDSICMKTAQNTICVGWLASQSDMLSNDWELIF